MSQHTLTIDQPVLVPDDGLLIGNGDLSVSVYNTADTLVFRFGKGDVWDRRLDLSDSPRPAHIDEVRRGLREEGWRPGPYGGPIGASRGPSKNPQRMNEICNGWDRARRPFPCPKPVGELALHLPVDLTGIKIHQRLTLETGILDVAITTDAGLKIELECFIPPTPNVLVIRWKRTGYHERMIVAPGRPPVWFSLYRWADPTIEQFGAKIHAATGDAGFRSYAGPKATPLPPPYWGLDGQQHFIEQAFPPDPTFPHGFSCRAAPMGAGLDIKPVGEHPVSEARLKIIPGDWNKEEGALTVAVTTTRDDGGSAAEAQRIGQLLGDNPAPVLAQWRDAAVKSVEGFWSRSAVRCSDPVIERTWYETLHARRCAFRPGRVAPGLFMPSSVGDYSPWRGNYTANYNVQSPYWGDYTANHVDDLADAFFEFADYAMYVGRKIARDYYGCRGAFIQLDSYPILAADDSGGGFPMSRMAYSTGWVSNHYWWRYLYTRDLEWLRARGYPAIRDFALFYTDFLQKWDDGLYHAFPSNQGEDSFPQKPEDCTDRPQVMRHMRYCLRAAIASAELLGVDADLCAQWRDRLDHAAPDNPPPRMDVGRITPELFERIPPEFYSPDGGPNPLTGQHELEFRFSDDPAGPSPWADKNHTPQTRYGWRLWTWYFGKVPWYLMINLRNGIFHPKRDWPHVRELIQRWRRPNGLHTAMCVGSFGHLGGWTEQLSIFAPLQEMMLQSWKGYIELFPAWPAEIDCEFRTLRAEGAFLVSAAWQSGRVASLTITSEKGGRCRIAESWPEGAGVMDENGKPVTIERTGRIAAFDTQAGRTYRVL